MGDARGKVINRAVKKRSEINEPQEGWEVFHRLIKIHSKRQK